MLLPVLILRCRGAGWPCDAGLSGFGDGSGGEVFLVSSSCFVSGVLSSEVVVGVGSGLVSDFF